MSKTLNGNGQHFLAVQAPNYWQQFLRSWMSTKQISGRLLIRVVLLIKLMIYFGMRRPVYKP